MNALQADTLRAFLPYESQSDALDDYMFLFTSMVQGFGEDTEEGLVNPKPLGETYSPLLEMGFFEDFDRMSLATYREFSDFLKAIRLREVVTSAMDVPGFHYMDVAERFDLTTLDLMVVLFLFFAATSDSFVRLLEERMRTFSGVFPSVGLLNRLVQRTFGVDSVATEVLAPDGKLCRWGLVHLQAPEGMDLASVFQNLTFLDDAVVQFLHSGDTGQGYFLHKAAAPDSSPRPWTKKRIRKG